jgi:peptidoglycan/LPS O-acetylase OafA/YrhL
MPPSAPAAGPTAAPPAGRNAAIDHIRILLTALVVAHHAAIAYGGSGGWYWREAPNASNRLLLLFNATNQSFFMGFFFLLAGYYTPRSCERKGSARYLGDRFLRLGVPLAIYFFTLHPLTVALARTTEGHPFWSGWWQMIRVGEFQPGPLWFAEALLVLALAFVAWRRLRPAAPNPAPARLPSTRMFVLTAIGLGLANFVVRLWIPVGRNVLWLQLGYFPCYLWLFAAGCAAARGGLLERITARDARPGLIAAALAWLCLPVVMVLRGAAGGFEGGWHFNAFFYALWDPFMAWGLILGLLWLARTRCSQATPLTAWFARNAFGAFIVHPPFVVGLGLIAAAWPIAPLAKFFIVAPLAALASFAAGDVLRRVPRLGRIL